MLDQYDIPLLGSDGTLHIVELKSPSVEHLITWHRNHWITGPEVHRAASQAMSYLRSLDEDGLGLSKKFENELGQHYDMSRVFATVVIGHSDHHRPARAARDVVARTLRQYNASLNRVEVITYDQLVESAERALAFENDSKNTGRQPYNQPMTQGACPTATNPGARCRQRRVGTTSRRSRRRAGAAPHDAAFAGCRTVSGGRLLVLSDGLGVALGAIAIYTLTGTTGVRPPN